MFAPVLFLLFSTAACDKAIAAAGITVKIKGQSGKMTLTVPDANGTMDVECRMASLRQLDASGATLGGGGSEKHSFNSFATQAFAFSEPTNATYQDLNVAKVSFDSLLVGSSKVKIDTFIFKEAGNLTVGNDTIHVPIGAVKFNVELSSWSWCGGSTKCKAAGGEGASVELDLSMAAVGKGSPNKTSGEEMNFDLGGGSKLMMFDTYSLDSGSTWIKMPTGYPKVSGSTFTLKFPRWTGTVMYDPIVAKTESTVDGGAGSASSGASSASTASGTLSAATRTFASFFSALSIVLASSCM